VAFHKPLFPFFNAIACLSHSLKSPASATLWAAGAKSEKTDLVLTEFRLAIV
jgi:hypothetical protein